MAQTMPLAHLISTMQLYRMNNPQVPIGRRPRSESIVFMIGQCPADKPVDVWDQLRVAGSDATLPSYRYANLPLSHERVPSLGTLMRTQGG
jgi:hypothetical protein